MYGGGLWYRSSDTLVDEVDWGHLDFMVIDLPPGTGDAYLAILQKLKIDESLIVTTSQSLLADTKKGIKPHESLIYL